MSLVTEYESTGNWLFRHRSFLPLLILPLLVPAVRSFEHFGTTPGQGTAWEVFSLSISVLGLLVRAFTIGFTPRGTSGRNTRQQIAEVLNTTGIYSLVRHPLYLGNFLSALGVVVFFHNLWLLLVTVCIYALYYERIMFAEEAFLRKRFGQTFEDWAAETPAFIPKLHGWRKPPLPFSLRNVLRREYTGVLLVTAGFFILETMTDSLLLHHLHFEAAWCALFATGVISYLILRTLKRHTTLLNVEGRC